MSNVNAVAFSPDGGWLATGSGGGVLRYGGPGEARVWEINTGEEIARVPHDAIVANVIFSPDNKWLATSELEGSTVRIWEAATGRQLTELPHKGKARVNTFSPNGHWLVTTNYQDHITTVWEVPSGREVHRIPGGGKSIFSSDGKWLVTASEKIVRIWEVALWQEVVEIEHEYEVQGVTLSLDNSLLATSIFGKVQLWESATGQQLYQKFLDGLETKVLMFSPDSKWLATASSDYFVRVWDVDTGKELSHLEHESTIFDVVFNANGRLLATAEGFNNTARIWKPETGTQIALLPHDGWVTDVEFSPDGQWLATASHDFTAQVWSIRPTN